MKGICHFVYDALSKNVEMATSPVRMYLSSQLSSIKRYPHNDIKSDNILILLDQVLCVLYLSLCVTNKAWLRKVLHFITFGNEKKHIKNYPQVAPEVKEGYRCEVFASDIYAFGRIVYKNDIMLTIPHLHHV